MNHPIIILLNAIEDIIGFVVTVWIYFAQCAIIVLVIVAFIPNITWFVFAQGLADMLVINPAIFVFEFFGSTKEYFDDADSVNGLHAFANMCGMLGSIILGIGIPAAFWFAHIIFGFVAASRFIMTPALMDRWVASEKANAGKVGVFDRNDFYLYTGRTTVDEVYQAEVDATAIATALKNK